MYYTCIAVNVAFETTLKEGLRFESRLFYSSFATVRVVYCWYMSEFHFISFEPLLE